MPFVRIDVAPSFDESRLRPISDAVHASLVETIDIPPADRFHVVRRCGPGELIWDRTFLDVERSDHAVFVQITFSSGRSDEKKRALYAAIAKNLSALAIRPEDVLIVLIENTRVNWSFGNGVAQYVPGEEQSRSAKPDAPVVAGPTSMGAEPHGVAAVAARV